MMSFTVLGRFIIKLGSVVRQYLQLKPVPEDAEVANKHKELGKPVRFLPGRLAQSLAQVHV